MDTQFLSHNSHLEGLTHFKAKDPDLAHLQSLTHVYTFPLLEDIPYNEPGIYALIGGCVTGKTTLLKQFMEKLLIENVPASSIFFLPKGFMTDHLALFHFLQTHVKDQTIQYFLIDDISTIPEWESALSKANTNDLLLHTIVIITDCNRSFARTKQIEIKQYFYLYPLTFRESSQLLKINEDQLLKAFNDFLLHGGHLPAINDLATTKKISDATLNYYANRLNKELLRQKKQEHFLREILTAIIQNYNEPITWNKLTTQLSIDHPKTIADYINLLATYDAVFIQSALLEKTLTLAPKKARKLMFTDPFIYHAIYAWLNLTKNSFDTQIIPSLNDTERCSQLVKSCVTTHFRRHFQTFYIKDEGEIDLAYIREGRFWPLLISWSNQLRIKDLKQLIKYQNAKILTKTLRSGMIEHVRTEPLPWVLWSLKR